MSIRRWWFGATSALVFSLLLLAPAHAQTPDRLSFLKISIWPEFDQPSVLVLYDGVLADTSNLPRAISILIPADAQLFVTTWYNPDGTLAPEQPAQQTKQDDGYTRVTFIVTQPKFRVEYYHDALRGAPDKTFDFAFKAFGAVDTLTLEIQEPLRATNFAVTPAPQGTRTDPDGFKYWTQNYTNIAANQVITARVKYTKTDPHPSVLPAANPSTSAPTTSAASDSTNWLLVVALVALGIAVVGGLLVLQRRALTPQPAPPPRAKKRRNKKRAATFCSQCGHTLAPTDKFCARCGTRRQEGK
ncbi:MAG: zinc-ribbon domain-containing protein [Anaerolineae bacterium]|nr:zinc-ribbon domain-containing protein [Anaerolineae bacterium]